MLTCWPVITEAAWLLRHQPDGVQKLLAFVATGAVSILTLGSEDARPISAILKKFHRLKPQIADAAIVHLAERESVRIVFTLDRRDFRVYRLKRGRALQIVP